MTETRAWLETWRRKLELRLLGAGVALTAGGVLLAFAGGVWLGHAGLYRIVPLLVVAAWVVAAALSALGWRWFQRRRARLAVPMLAREVERGGGARAGLVAGIAAWNPSAGSASLAAVADGRTARWLDERGDRALAGARRATSRALVMGSGVLVLGLSVLAASGPARGRGAEVFHPLALLARARSPVQLTVDRAEVRRGDSVTAVVRAAGRHEARLWVRAPGEPWRDRLLALDTAGAAVLTLGPLDSDRFLRADAGGRTSATVHVRVLLPAFLADLQLLARFPSYLGRPDEPLVDDGQPIALPVGTRIDARGQASVAVGSATWVRPDGAIRLTARGRGFEGTIVVRGSARWELALRGASGEVFEGEPPVLQVLAVADSAPVVTVPVPGADTVAPLSLRQPLVIDARDDHRIVAVELTSWRVSRFGERGEARSEPIPLPEDGTDRAVLHWTLDLNGRGLLPGDTAYFQVRARDNAPDPQVGASPLYRLRLASMGELRRELRDATRDAAAAAESLRTQQQDIARGLEDLAAERERGDQPTTSDGRDARNATPDQLPFSSVERARELLDRQNAMVGQAEELRKQVRELSEAAWAAGLTDPTFQQQLRDLERLLDRALSPELAQRLAELREAIERLDAPAVRDALQQLAEAAQQLREEMRRSEELLRRAAIEGDMTSLAEDADELAQRQEAWNDAARLGVDSNLTAVERQLAAEGDTLARALEQLSAELDSAGMTPGDLSQSAQHAQRASGAMQRAAQAGQRGDQRGAQQAGQEASQSLDPLADQLRQERERMREEWRQEVLAQLDRALVEAADLARSQRAVAEQLSRGETGNSARGGQAAVREGVDRVLGRLEAASGMNALVSPRLGAALGFAQLRMAEALEQLQRPNPSGRQAASSANDALDALNAAVHALLQTRGQVAGAESGSGLQEAMEQMAQLANQQGGLNQQTGGLLSMMPQGGEQLLSELRAIAERERALAAELERLRNQGQISGADELAEEARDIAGALESGRLNRETVERQEQLFRRLLDAGRTLRSDDEDEREERVSRTADPTAVRSPDVGAVLEGEPRFRYPSWDVLRLLSPDDRRLILDYFRRLNARDHTP